jgi:hypothetical protein
VAFGSVGAYARVGTYESLKKLASRANPTIVCYNASAVKIYNVTYIVRFENRNVFFYFEKCSSLPQHWFFQQNFLILHIPQK